MNAWLRLDEPVGRHVPARVGGQAAAYVVAHDDQTVCQVLSQAKSARWPVLVMGCGSKTLVRDGGYDGVVLRLGPRFCHLRIVDPGVLEIGAATPVAAVVAWAVTRGLSVPDSMFTATGSFGSSVLIGDWDVVSARVARRSGVKKVDGSKIGSRVSGVVVSARIRFDADDNASMVAVHKALRVARQPAGSWYASARGSVRKTLHLAALDRVRLRDIVIPDAAPEVMVNLGGGLARDVHLLQQSAIERVKRTRGVSLTSTKKWTGQKTQGGTR